MTFSPAQEGYVLSEETGIWTRPEFEGIAYNDGTEIETAIGKIIAEANDVSVLSDELPKHCVDWPTTYHLSHERGNVLRPFEALLDGADVLEVGAGMGPVSRYLGESGANVVALEGSPRRAAIARSRCRDLPNVQVLSERFEAFTTEQRFDIVTLVGVLEYAKLFTTAENAGEAFLEQCRGLLKEGGLLILAIENRLGVKYFAGAPEDHVGKVSHGIEDLYDVNQVETYGEVELRRLLDLTGFHNQRFLGSFPDYKLPRSLITESGFQTDSFDAGALAVGSAVSDPQLPGTLAFSPERVVPQLVANGLGLAMANSFVILASERPLPTADESLLAYHYSANRHAAFCKGAEFRVSEGGGITVESTPLGDPNTYHGAAGKALWQLEASTPYIEGTSLADELAAIVAHHGWALSQAADFIKVYLDCLDGFSAGTALEIRDHDTFVPGALLDAIPQNIIRSTDGDMVFIDREWSWKEPIPAGWLVVRTLLSLAGPISRWAPSKDEFERNPLAFMVAVLNELSWNVDAGTVKRYLQMEAEFQALVSPLTPKAQGIAEWLDQVPLGRAFSDEVIPQLEGRNAWAVESYEQQLADLNERQEVLLARIAKRTEQVERLRSRITAMEHSQSWKLTRPLRRITGELQRRRG